MLRAHLSGIDRDKWWQDRQRAQWFL